mmetsp:Transcript_54660/g.140731  ORF Transcript_54660/g.140731 Transcript_54660/m.140731 type:complete len:223 (+) Transcript_54660:446-1114(+)
MDCERHRLCDCRRLCLCRAAAEARHVAAGVGGRHVPAAQRDAPGHERADVRRSVVQVWRGGSGRALRGGFGHGGLRLAVLLPIPVHGADAHPGPRGQHGRGRRCEEHRAPPACDEFDWRPLAHRRLRRAPPVRPAPAGAGAGGPVRARAVSGSQDRLLCHHRCALEQGGQRRDPSHNFEGGAGKGRGWRRGGVGTEGAAAGVGRHGAAMHGEWYPGRRPVRL